jgi:ElaB/YqjD/DUF883 family membrane-anchored ribosome-binding protein
MNYQRVRPSGMRTADAQDQLQALREDFRQLVKLVENLAGGTGAALTAELRSRLDRFAHAMDEAVSDASGRGRQAASLLNDLGSSARRNAESAVRGRPLGTLALAVAAGFILAAFIRR